MYSKKYKNNKNKQHTFIWCGISMWCALLCCVFMCPANIVYSLAFYKHQNRSRRQNARSLCYGGGGDGGMSSIYSVMHDKFALFSLSFSPLSNDIDIFTNKPIQIHSHASRWLWAADWLVRHINRKFSRQFRFSNVIVLAFCNTLKWYRRQRRPKLTVHKCTCNWLGCK